MDLALRWTWTHIPTLAGPPILDTGGDSGAGLEAVRRRAVGRRWELTCTRLDVLRSAVS